MCYGCVDMLFYDYKETLGDDEAAMERVCMKLDVYWHPEVYAMVQKSKATNASRVRHYMSRVNLLKYCDKTYDDTIDEEYAAEQEAERNRKFGITQSSGDSKDASRTDSYEPPPISQEDYNFWGSGYPDEFYNALKTRYEYWTKDLQKPLDSAEEALYKHICILEATITRNTIEGKPVETTVKQLNDLIGSVNRKPSQQKTEADIEFGDLPLGVGIKIYENARPIPKPIPEFEDVDGVKRYISIWFLGHLCKMLGIKNTYCKLYEDELEKMRLDRPDLEEEDDEGLFNEIFGGDSG